ncbi:MAG: polyphosphate kinase 1 [Gammaproteobacteria bacterium]|nr:polyphosphate kinase 1 [Gammaproteobacteria bacterium]
MSPDSATATAEETSRTNEYDLDAPEWYLNRELTWLEFNSRVLHEGEDPRTPLLERVKFLAIVSSNLDEFFMKRIGGLMQQVGAGVTELSPDGRTPTEQIDACHDVVRGLKERQTRLTRELYKALAKEGIVLTLYRDLDTGQQASVREHYLQNVFPLITPLAMDPAHPFPFISNLSLNLLVTVRTPGSDQPSLVRIKAPVGSGVPRFLQVGDATVFVTLEDVIAANLDLLLPGMEIEACEYFRVTRNAIVEKASEQANDLLELIESELRDRRFAPMVRLEVSAGMDPLRRGMLAAELGLDEEVDVFEVDGLMAKRDLLQIATLGRLDLRDPPHHPVDHPRLASAPNLFHEIRDHGPVLLQHPYESFVTSVERFLLEASRDPKVLAIKMTLYRTASDSKVIRYLMDAAENGKQVAVCVELKARFDESANIRWANRLEEAGIHVSYGVLGLKTHSKVIFVVRRDYDGLRRYAHIGTGNYHAGTARLYSDLGLLTCDPDIGADLTELFNYITTGHVPKRTYRKLLPAPKVLKPALLDKIEREIKGHSQKSPGHIRLKMNALEDLDVTRALYRAAQAGVKVEMVVRDTCRLRPGIPGLSDNVTVISLVGRFLEHTRIFHFRNGGDDEYFIGSADCMRRNLESRVEVVTPVEDPDLRRELGAILDMQLADRRSAWELQPDGSYVQREPRKESEARSAQELSIEAADARIRSYKKPKGRQKKKKAKGGRNR